MTSGSPPPVATVMVDPGVRYPRADSAFSPSESYPEYPFDDVAATRNPVYEMVRELLATAQLDRPRLGTAGWNPLGRWISPGNRVFVLCNFVYHRRRQESLDAFLAKCTHGSVLRAVLDYVHIATGGRGLVEFGNAPLQSCDWSCVLEETGAAAVERFYREQGAPCRAKDLRLFVAPRTEAGRVVTVERRRATDSLDIDLGERSLLAGPQAAGPNPYRVSDYDPDRTGLFHNAGSHVYNVHRAVLDADVVVSISKLKTHEKVGITCGLKGFVGVVGLKDCLAHHRYGSPAIGGDEYPQQQGYLRPVSALHDWVQRQATQAGRVTDLLTIADRSLRRVVRKSGHVLAGAWDGNDTAWRMALDLAAIVHFAGSDGSIEAVPQRRTLSFIDGVIAGEGQGPLAPSPVHAGAAVFAAEVASGDAVAARLMGFDPERLPIVREAGRLTDMALPALGSDADVRFNGTPTRLSTLPTVLGRPFRPPVGWPSLVGSSSLVRSPR